LAIVNAAPRKLGTHCTTSVF
jgi:hypothetical protein